VIFWFAVLGVAGAFIYRVVDWLANGDYSLSEDQKEYFVRMQQIMDWPAAQLMTLSLAIATDFDSVFKAWKQYHDEQGHGLFEGDNGFLLAAARSVVLTGHAARDGYADQLDGPMIALQQAMDLTWRMLGVWMTVLALLLLISTIV
jgi:AmpE protein